MLAEIQVSPRPYGTEDSPHAHVHPALELIRSSGLHHEVHALGTVVEGTPDEVWALLRAVHESVLEHGADSTASIIKVHQQAVDTADTDATPAMDRLTARWR